MAEEHGQTAFHFLVEQISSKTFEEYKVSFKEALERGQSFASVATEMPNLILCSFDKLCREAVIEQDANTVKQREVFRQNVLSFVSSLRSTKLSEVMSSYEKKLNKALSEPTQSLLKDANDETWPRITRLLQLERMTTLVGFTSTLYSFSNDQTTVEAWVANLERYAIGIIKYKAKEEAGRVLMNMQDRFERVFSYDSDSMPRMWTEKEDIKTITKMARLASLKLLAVLARIRLDEKPDNIEEALQLALMDGFISSTLSRNLSLDTLNALASNTWGDVPSTTLISPVQCKSIWEQFNKNTIHIVERAIIVQETNKRNNNWLPPSWTIAVMLILGFNEFMTLLRNPLYLGIIFVAFLLAKGLWVQLDISGEFQNGALIGILSLSTKFLSTLMDLLKKRVDQGQRRAGLDTGRNL